MKILNIDPFSGGEWPPSNNLECKHINVSGRKEREAIIRNAEKCKELGLDQIYEAMIYLKTYGNWLDE